MLKGVGYAICVIDIYVGMFYNTVIGWAVYYFISSIVSAGQVKFQNDVYQFFLCLFDSNKETIINPIWVLYNLSLKS